MIKNIHILLSIPLITVFAQTLAGPLVLKNVTNTVREGIPSTTAKQLVGASIQSLPNDPLLSCQWSISKTHLSEAWDVQTGSNLVTVGVIDTGIDSTHPDLINRVDVTDSRDFTGRGNPFSDEVIHGTHVAGILGAQGNNGIGISGVCWNVKMVSLKVGNISDSLPVTNIVSAINYASQKQIPILNASLTTIYDVPELRQAIENYHGLLVCSAGNDGRDIDAIHTYPASYIYDNVLTVGASNSNDENAYFSNWGANSVDVFAPGFDIYSTVPGGGYDNMSGTSMATAFVSGLAALLLSKDSNMQVNELKQAVIENIDLVEGFAPHCVSGGIVNSQRIVTNGCHIHHYEASYSPDSVSKHRAYCSCGEYILQNHHFGSSYSRGTHVYCSCDECRYVVDITHTIVPHG
jgi:thermitase